LRTPINIAAITVERRAIHVSEAIRSPENPYLVGEFSGQNP
jgi:hypothetical protein